jgi:hypothetical protein
MRNPNKQIQTIGFAPNPFSTNCKCHMGMGLGFNNVNFGSQFGRDTWGRPTVAATPPYFLNQSSDSLSCNNGNNWNTRYLN